MQSPIVVDLAPKTPASPAADRSRTFGSRVFDSSSTQSPAPADGGDLFIDRTNYSLGATERRDPALETAANRPIGVDREGVPVSAPAVHLGSVNVSSSWHWLECGSREHDPRSGESTAPCATTTTAPFVPLPA